MTQTTEERWPALPYDAWRETYEQAAGLARWDRATLERAPVLGTV